MRNIDYVNETSAEVLKKRFKSAQEKLKEKCWKLGDFRKEVLQIEPQFNTPEGWEVIKNTWYGRLSNVRLTEIIVELSKRNAA